MATSNSYNYSTTRNNIITGAFRKIGSLGDYETITDSINAGKLTAGINALNPMIKAFSAQGMHVWANEIVSVNMSNWTTGNPSYTLTTTYKPLKCTGAWRRDNIDATDPIDAPLEVVSEDIYQTHSAKLSESAPTKVYFKPSRTSSVVTLWPIPDTYWRTNGILRLRLQRQFQDFDSAADEPDFPIEWEEALIYNLAVRLAPEYGLPQIDRTMLKQEAKEFLDAVLGFDREDESLYFQPARR